MIRAFRIFFVACLLTPASASAAVRPVPAACVICGHVCCCPEVCAAKIAALKTSEAPSTTAGCGGPTETCRFGARNSSDVCLEPAPASIPVPALAEATAPRAVDEGDGLPQNRLIRTRTLPTPPITTPPRVV